jgi:hypothetical protein
MYNSIIVYEHTFALVLTSVEEATRCFFWC